MRKLEEESCDLSVVVCGGEGATRGKGSLCALRCRGVVIRGTPPLRLAGQPQESRAKVSGVPVILSALSGAMALILVEVP